jgi:hypothetical protein
MRERLPVPAKNGSDLRKRVSPHVPFIALDGPDSPSSEGVYD